MTNEVIISNQVKCLKCGDEPFSAHRHDFKSCKCGNISVDGGQAYLKRMYKSKNFKDMSIVLDQDLVDAMINMADWSQETGRNSFGYVCAIARAIRDSGYKIVPVEEK